MKSLPCPPARWPAFSRLLDEAMALPPGRRAAWLAALGPEDADLHAALGKVLAALASAEAAPEFLSSPASKAPTTGHAAAGLQAGMQVGPYELLHELGRGGMGEVWLARRVDGAYQREVALKLPHAHLLAGAVRERFLRERDILASLSHPHIARFYDAGLSATGQPYLALEAVEGLPITRWADEQRLGLTARLALFLQVSAAVEHAHGKLIAHRDLKPANVLVGCDGEVRLLDFGIAKMLHEGDGAQAPLTRAEARLATPAYAAPEQLAGGAVTVATDIYALAAMLFELLTGAPPFDAEPLTPRLRASRAAERGDPPLASHRITPAHAQILGRTPKQLRHDLAGDLDAILGKGLQPHPEERYASVAALAADLGRHQRNEPIEARHITTPMRVAKFLRRNRLSAAFSGLLAASLVAGVAGVAWQGQRAQAQARRAEAVKDFLLDVFKASDPRLASDTPRGQITAKALLDASAPRIEARFKGDPEVQIELLRTAADIYRELGENEAYETLQNRQLELARQHYGPLHDNVLDGQLEAAVRAMERADYAACRQLLEHADRAIKQAGRDDSAQRGHWWLTRSVCLRDQPQAQAERTQALQQALRIFERHAPADRGHVTTLAEMATEAAHQNRYEASIALNRRAIAVAERQPGRNDAELQTLQGNMALSLMSIGDLAGAEIAYARSAEIARRTSGEQARAAWAPAGKRARVAHLAGARDRATQLFDEVMKHLPPDAAHDPDAQNVREDRGERYAAEGQPLLAIPLLEAVERSWMLRPAQEFALRRVRQRLGDAYDRAGRSADARQTFQKALADFEGHAPADGQPMAAMRERWGRFLLDQGEFEAARVQFERVRADAADKHWSHVALAEAGLARAALRCGDAAAAGRLSEQALQTWSRLSGFRDVRMEPYLWRVRAAALVQLGDTAAAETLRDQALAASRQYDAPQSPTVRDRLHVGI